MATANAYANAKDFQVEHIGPAPHTLRNILTATGIVLLIGLLSLFYWHTKTDGNVAIGELEQFREAMYNRCGGQQFSGPAEQPLTQLYVDSSRIRTVVVQQFHQLQRANANCEEVVKALRSVDYPIR